MAELRGACCFARPVATRVIGGIFISCSVCLRAGQHVVYVGCVPSTVDRGALLGQPRNLPEVVAKAREFQSVSVQIRQVIGDLFALSVVPGTIANAISG